MTRQLTIGTRGSRLALRQTDIVIEMLAAVHGGGVTVVTREISTEGDRSSAPLTEIGGLGVFTKSIEDALAGGEIDVAVHSLKDLPPVATSGLMLAAIPRRADPRDALVTHDGAGLAGLRRGARIGTGSERRAVQLRAMRNDVEPVSIRGNVDTRVRKVDAGEYDAAVLAVAGLERLGLRDRAAQVFSIDEMIPSPGQGALAVQVRADDEEARAIVAAIDHADTRACVMAERAFLERIGAGCRMAVGAYARREESRILLTAMVGSAVETIAVESDESIEALAASLMARA